MSSKVILLVAGLTSCLSSPALSYKLLKYTVPQPLIRAFRPNGLEASIPHTDGVQLFAFHANINEPLDAMKPAVIEQDVYRREGDRWRVWNAGSRLKIGDEVFYTVFVVRNGLGYRLQDQKFKVTALEDLGEVHTPTALGAAAPHISVCDKILVNLTQNLLDSQRELAALRETNDLLRDMVNKHPDTSRTLSLDGVHATDDYLGVIVRGIIQEKLQLPFDVTNMTRRDALVRFQVGSLDEKLQVIRAAKRKLKYSRYVITY